MKNEGYEIEAFVEEMTKRIVGLRIEMEKKSSKYTQYTLSSPIDFELSVLIKKKAGGKLNILLVEAGGNYEQESISKIRFSINSIARQALDMQIKVTNASSH